MFSLLTNNDMIKSDFCGRSFLYLTKNHKYVTVVLILKCNDGKIVGLLFELRELLVGVKKQTIQARITFLSRLFRKRLLKDNPYACDKGFEVGDFLQQTEVVPR